MLQRTILALAAVLACTGVGAREADKAAPADRGALAAAKPNGSGIALRVQAPARVDLGQPATVTLRLAGVDAPDASVEVRAPAGLTITPSPAAVALPRGVETTLTLSVVPTTHGVHYLDVFTRQHGRLTAHSIAVSTGTATTQHLKATGTVQTTPAGERVISLPAQ
jgi:hypothetical protein